MLEKYYPLVKMVRYADDLIVHCISHEETVETLAALKERLTERGLTAYPEKTKIVYCKKDGRNLNGHPVHFDFLGFSFQPIRFRLKQGGRLLQFDCKMSRKSKARITGELRKLDFNNKTQRGIQELANLLNPNI